MATVASTDFGEKSSPSGHRAQGSRQGLRIEAVFCPETVGDAFETVEWELRNAEIKDENGQLLSGSYMDYTMPRADDVPSFDVDRSQHRRGAWQQGWQCGASVRNRVRVGEGDASRVVHRRRVGLRGRDESR